MLTRLAIEHSVVVSPHLWVNIVEVPVEALTLQTLSQSNPLRDVSKINTRVLQKHKESLSEVFGSAALYISINITSGLCAVNTEEHISLHDQPT